MFGNEYRPCPFVTAVCEIFVAMLVTVTVAPGRTPPSASLTIPDNDVVDAAPCANANDVIHTRLATNTASLKSTLRIAPLPLFPPPPGPAAKAVTPNCCLSDCRTQKLLSMGRAGQWA